MKFLMTIILTTLVASASWASQTYSVKVVKQAEQKWLIQHLSAYSTDEGVRITGRLNSLHKKPGLPRGHVDVAAYSPSGELLAETTSDFIPGMVTRTQKKKGGLRFSASFKEKLPADAVLKVAFHREASQSRPKPVHSKTIAQ